MQFIHSVVNAHSAECLLLRKQMIIDLERGRQREREKEREKGRKREREREMEKPLSKRRLVQKEPFANCFLCEGWQHVYLTVEVGIGADVDDGRLHRTLNIECDFGNHRRHGRTDDGDDEDRVVVEVLHWVGVTVVRRREYTCVDHRFVRKSNGDHRRHRRL